MKKLYLVRHCKAAAATPAADDHARPLAGRGPADAAAIAAHLAAHFAPPDLVVSSPAARAVETAQALAAAFTPPPPLRLDAALYEASAGDVLARVHAEDDGRSSLMVVGHNPALGELAARLAADPTMLAGGFPTGAVAGFTFATVAWADVSAGDGAVFAYLTPKTLP